MDKETVLKNFSKYASSYDRNTGVQRKAGGILAKMLPKSGIANILEIGCGTGSYTYLLKELFKDAKIDAIDISEAMIGLARRKLSDERTSFEVGDAGEIASSGKYDLITSNAAFHWFADIEGVLAKTARSLQKNGVLIFSSFGPATFSELRASLASVVGGKVSIASDLFPNKKGIEESLEKHFKNIKITERLIRESYPSLVRMLKKIKYSGTRGSGAGLSRVWTPDLLNNIEKEYMTRFGAIEATYQIFFCEAEKCR